MSRAGICHLTTVHRPDDVRIFGKQCRTLAAAGFRVTLVARGDPPLGAAVVGAPAQAVPAPGVSGRGSGAALRFRQLPAISGRLARMTLGLVSAFSAALRTRARVVHLHDPELLPVGLLLRLCGRRVVYDVHENVPGSVRGKPYLPLPLRRPLAVLAGVVERALAAGLDGIVVAEPDLARRFPGARRRVLVQNFPVAAEFAGPRADVGAPTLVYVGGITADRGARLMVEALEHCRAERLVLAGPIRPGALGEALRTLPGWRRVEYHPWLDRDGVSRLLRRATLGLCVLDPVPNYVRAQPIKLFEYLAAGLPPIASDFPLWRELLRDDEGPLAWFVPPGDAAALGRVIDAALDDPAARRDLGRRGRAAVARRFSWESEGRRLTDLHGELACAVS